MNTVMCFADNRDTVELAFRDYMAQYMSEVGKRDGYVYDKSVSFAEKEQKVNKLMMNEISKLAGLSFAATSVSPEMMSSNPMLRWASFAVVNSMIDMIVPEVLDKSIGLYTEQRYGNYGDDFSFTVEPNDLFYVSKAGRDMRTTEFQKAFVGQTTIVPENRAITVAVNFYKVLCGKESLAKFVMKAILSLEAQITKEVFIAFNTAMGEIPTTAADDNLHITGWAQDSAVRLAQTVSAYNNGADPIFLGTKLALNKALPANSNYRYDIQSDYVRVGYIRNFMGYDAMEMKQVADWKNPHKLILDDKRIYVISPSTQKPVKLCYEGASRTTNMDFAESADLTSSTTIQKSYGIGIATNALVGVIDLA
jgi:hypothetical protein